MRRWVCLGILLLIFVTLPERVFASKKITFNTNKITLLHEEEIELIASCSGFSSGEQLFIKGVFFKEGSTNYFGYTKKNDSWIKNSTKITDQRQVSIDSWDGKLQVKSDADDSGFSDSGTYKLKIGFYTINSSGDPSSVSWSETITDITLNKPSPTNTPSSTPTKTPTPKKTPTSTIAPTKSLTQTPIQTPMILVSIVPSDTQSIVKETSEEQVLSESTEAAAIPASESSPLKDTLVESSTMKTHSYVPIFISICIGLFLGISSLVFYIKIRMEKRKEKMT